MTKNLVNSIGQTPICSICGKPLCEGQFFYDIEIHQRQGWGNLTNCHSHMIHQICFPKNMAWIFKKQIWNSIYEEFEGEK
jgi:hypothetical protein